MHHRHGVIEIALWTDDGIALRRVKRTDTFSLAHRIGRCPGLRLQRLTEERPRSRTILLFLLKDLLLDQGDLGGTQLR